MVTIAILIITCAVSLIFMRNMEFKGKHMFNAYAIQHNREWHRFISGGFLHANEMHLLVNMMTLYFFGPHVEKVYCSEALFGERWGSFMFALMYISAIIISSLYSFFKHRNNPHYNALGASGAVSAVLYSALLFFPMQTIYLFFAIPVNFALYGVIYLVYSNYMSRKGTDNIGHDAHFWGAVYGFIFPVIFNPQLAVNFVRKIAAFFTGL
ncbi:MAG TPA: rhomboid family intramembrane serine protease [Bacteroidia bacterium]|nr:rhomboid family intramembrane serine protease [Bacteroidia bacterium]